MRTKKILTAEEQAARSERRKEQIKDWKKKNRERIREYQREYRKAHPEQVKEAQLRYWMKKIEMMKGST